MKILKYEITEKEFEALCEVVCRRISPAGSVNVDAETMYFAIFWTVCDTVGELVATPESNDPLVGDYRARIGTTVSRIGQGGFDAALIADRVISGFLTNVKSDFMAPFLQPAGWFEGGDGRGSGTWRYFSRMSPSFRQFCLNLN